MKITYHNTESNSIENGTIRGEYAKGIVRKFEATENKNKFRRHHGNLLSAAKKAVSGKQLTQGEFDILSK